MFYVELNKVILLEPRDIEGDSLSEALEWSSRFWAKSVIFFDTFFVKVRALVRGVDALSSNFV